MGIYTSYSYLPSLQIALSLDQNKLGSSNINLDSLLSIENPRNDLVFAEIESNIVNTYFANLESSITTIEDFKNAIPSHTHFHFTGHSNYNFDDPKGSCLEFANFAKLTAYKISHLSFNTYQLIIWLKKLLKQTEDKVIDSNIIELINDEIRKYEKEDPNLIPDNYPYYWLGFMVNQ